MAVLVTAIQSHAQRFTDDEMVSGVGWIKRSADPTPVENAAGVASSLTLDTTYILNTPNRMSGMGALSAADNASATTRRVSAGAMIPSSHNRAVA
jgi:hypothetical protein